MVTGLTVNMLNCHGCIKFKCIFSPIITYLLLYHKQGKHTESTTLLT
jgi:hypothetical protein